MKVSLALFLYLLPSTLLSQSLAEPSDQRGFLLRRQNLAASTKSAPGTSAAETTTLQTNKQQATQSSQSTQTPQTTQDQTSSSASQQVVTVTRTASVTNALSAATTSPASSSENSSHSSASAKESTVSSADSPASSTITRALSASTASNTSSSSDSTSTPSPLQTMSANPVQNPASYTTTATPTSDNVDSITGGGIAIGALFSAIILSGLAYTGYKYFPQARARYLEWRQHARSGRRHLVSGGARDEEEASIVKGMGLGLGEITILRQNSDMTRFEDIEYHNAPASEVQDIQSTPSTYSLQETLNFSSSSQRSVLDTPEFRPPIPPPMTRADLTPRESILKGNPQQFPPETPISYIQAKKKYIPYRPQRSTSPIPEPQAASLRVARPLPPSSSSRRMTARSSLGRIKRLSKMGFHELS